MVLLTYIKWMSDGFLKFKMIHSAEKIMKNEKKISNMLVLGVLCDRLDRNVMLFKSV